MKTSRAGSRRRLARCQRSRRLHKPSCRRGGPYVFERLSFTAQEAPDGIMRDRDAARCQQVLQPMQRQMRRLLDLGKDEGTMRREGASPVATELGWRGTARLAHALRPLHDRRRRDIEALGDRAASLALANGCGNARTQVSGIGLRHACWPPAPARILKQKPSDLGIPGFQLIPKDSRVPLQATASYRPSETEPQRLLAPGETHRRDGAHAAAPSFAGGDRSASPERD